MYKRKGGRAPIETTLGIKVTKMIEGAGEIGARYK